MTLSPETDFCSLGLQIDLLISLQVSCFVQLAQWMKRTLSDRLGQRKGVLSIDVDMFMPDREKSGRIRGLDRHASPWHFQEQGPYKDHHLISDYLSALS